MNETRFCLLGEHSSSQRHPAVHEISKESNGTLPQESECLPSFPAYWSLRPSKVESLIAVDTEDHLSMNTNHEPALNERRPLKLGLIFCSTALLSFFAGIVFASNLLHPRPVQASSDRVFELMIYHTLPGKVSALESIFRDSAARQAKHGLDVVGYWVPNEDPAWNDTFIYLIAHPSRAEADAHWKEFHSDPEFPAARKAAAALIQQENGIYKVDEIYMRPTDFSRMK